jgi:hypothetical protein
MSKVASLQATASAVTLPVITKAEIDEAIELRKQHSLASKTARIAEQKCQVAQMKIFEKLLGIKSADELKWFSPEQIEKIFTERINKKTVLLEDPNSNFKIEQTSAQRRPEWKELYIQALGESKATEAHLATPMQYSYAIKESD